ncbi:MAG: YkvA family protein [Methanomicrobiales archaeon]
MEEVEFKDFYDVLRENLEDYEGCYEDFIDYGPDLFKLLTDVLNEKEVSADIRLKISAAIAYYVAPFDIIPETIYGPNGYIDDIYVCIYVLKEIEEVMGYQFLEDLWECESDLKEVVDVCYEKCKNVVEDKIDYILKYVGLIE